MISQSLRLTTAGFLFAALVPSVYALDYPVRTVRIVVPTGAGSNGDLVARLLAVPLETHFKQPFIVDNRPGAGGIIGTESVVRSAPDGYTLLYAASASTTFKVLNKDVSFELTRDLVPVSLTVMNQAVHLVSAALPVRSLPELIAYAKKNPGKLNYASFGRSSVTLGIEAFKHANGIEMFEVPFKGGPEQIGALVRNEVQYVVSSPGVAKTFVQSGQVRAIAVSGTQRSEVLPEVATTTEQGFGDYVMPNTLGIMAPRATPGEIVDKLAAAIIAISRQPDYRQKIAALSTSVIGSTPEEFRRHLESEMRRWEQVAKRANIVPE
jgi:tripartite-type tricarboxylate transporter receptor subunit TctC